MIPDLNDKAKEIAAQAVAIIISAAKLDDEVVEASQLALEGLARLQLLARERGAVSNVVDTIAYRASALIGSAASVCLKTDSPPARAAVAGGR